MTHHPHIHMIAPGGGISPDGTSWVSCRPHFFLHVLVLSRLFLERLMAAYKAGRLRFLGGHAGLADRIATKAHQRGFRRMQGKIEQTQAFLEVH